MVSFFVISIMLPVCFASSVIREYNFFPNLPAGEFRIKFNAVFNCNPTSNNKINFNWYLSKKSANATEVKGNITSQIQVDDSLDLQINMAVKDSIGGWKDNAFIYKSAKACSTLKNFLGKSWDKFRLGVGYPNANCPLQPGVYVAPGCDTTIFEMGNFPKTFFYGTYKFRFHYSNKSNEKFGCITAVIEIKRPWEMY